MTSFPVETFPFDTPERLVSMLVDGELTGPGASAAFFNPSSLTPKERDGIAERLKRASGNSRIGNALVDLATNPLVWFYFATSPIGVTAIARGGTTVFQSAGKSYSALIKRGGATFGWATTAQQVAERTIVDEVMAQIGTRRMALQTAFSRRLGPSLQGVLKGNGLSSLDWQEIVDPVARRKAQEISETLMVVREGRHLPNPVERIVSVQKGKLKFDDVPVARVDPARVQAKIDEYGLGDLIQESDTFFRERSDELLLTDTNRLRRIFNVVRNKSIRGGAAASEDTIQGAELVRMVLGPMSEGVELGRMSFDDFERVIEAVVRQPVRTNANVFVPRNVFEDVFQGKAMSPDAFATLRGNPLTGARVSPTVFNRETKSLLTHPEDLEFQIGLFGDPTGELGKQLKQARSVFEETSGRPIRFLRRNFNAALLKYEDSTARTLAISDPPSQGVLAKNKALRDELKPTMDGAQEAAVGGKGFSSVREELQGKIGTNVEESMLDHVKRGAVPEGGFSVIDALEADWKLVKSGYAQRVISDIIAPSMMGIATSRALWQMEGLLKAKESAIALADSKFGQVMAGRGSTGERFVEGLRNWGNKATTLNGAQGYTRAVANVLYVTHLGINMSSVVLNSMQPFIAGPLVLGFKPFLGASEDSLLGAYGTAVGEMFDYGRKRVQRFGFSPISKVDNDTLKREVFAFANVPVPGAVITRGAEDVGEDLLGVTSSAFELIDSVAMAGVRQKIGVEGRLTGESLFGVLMKPFELAEWLNRSVTAYAVRNFRRSKGLSVGTVEEAGDVRRAVQELQFGASTLNTVVAFQTPARSGDLGGPLGSVLNGPLLRQFLNFQTRSFIQPFAFTSKLADTRRTILGRELRLGRVGASGFDILRGIGAGAIVYELGKNVLGADLSRGLFFSAQTDVIPGIANGKFVDPTKDLPIPPIFDIPFNIAYGLIQGDGDLLTRQLGRVIPGGVALTRAANALPALPGPLGALQNRFADYDNLTRDEEGNLVVPLHKASDGTFLGYEPVLGLLARSAGVDLGAGDEVLRRERAMLANRDVAVGLAREAILALANGDSAKARRISIQYQKRFGIPLRISPRRIAGVAKLVEQSRSDRIRQNLPSDVRQLFDRGVGVSEEDQARRRVDRIAVLQAAKEIGLSGEETLPGATPRNTRFEGFGGF